MPKYMIANGAMPTTAAFVPVATGTSIKTMLQIKPGATTTLKIHGWGVSFSGFVAAAPGKVELIETDVAATVTAHVAADLTKYDEAALLAGDPTTALIAVGTSATGYTSSSEGTITATRNLDAPQQIAPTGQFIQWFPQGAEPTIQNGKFGRIRVTFAASVDAYAWMLVGV